jgi:translation initiation factor 2B subunit (eIF-2B alpha/beta/delta family)
VSVYSHFVVEYLFSYIMENVDFVLLGAEGVVETGGILNKVG